MKRRIPEVRNEIHELYTAIQHGVVRGDGIAYRYPELVTIDEARARSRALLAEYPRARPKFMD